MSDQIEQHLETPATKASHKGCRTWKWCWWNPHQESLSAEFFNQSSLHGLQYIGQPRRHITERIFWLVAFLIGLTAAGLLIYFMIDRYENTPVVVSFQSKEQPIDTIPFPAVTLCNINQFSKKKVLELERIASLPDHEHSKDAERNLTQVKTLCKFLKSFVQQHGFGKPKILDDDNYDDVQKHMLDILVENSNSCDQMIPLCSFGGKTIECSDHFKTVVTEFGKCCSFNMMPLPLIFKNPSNEKNLSIFNYPAGTDLQWTEEEMKNWSLWNYDEGFHISESKTSESYHPIRQSGSGMPYGLSLLVDPITDDYYCPTSYFKGFAFTLHTPVEMPDVRDFPSVLDTDKEIYIQISPDVTFADEDIRNLASEKRQCYFGKEKELKLFKPYTRENCVDDCIASYIAKECQCASFFMPREDKVRVCDIDVESEDGKCVAEARDLLRTHVKNICGHCLALCEDIEYKYESTMATLQNTSEIWKDMVPQEKNKPEWADHKVSMVHIFFGSLDTVPKLRKRLYGITDLIANTGGILGLCLGFSGLSAVELIYFVCVRTLWKYCHMRNSLKAQRKTSPELNRRDPSMLKDIETIK